MTKENPAMTMNTLNNTKISLLGIGTMRLPTIEQNESNIDLQASRAMFDYAISHGINYFDTAYLYHQGQSESVTGELLSHYPRESFLLATKLPAWMLKESGDMERIFNEQLKKCRVDYFDFYLCHNMLRRNYPKYTQFGILKFLDRMKKEGRIRHLGFSFHDEPPYLEEVCDLYDWDFGQLQLNYLDWELQDAKTQHEILERHGIPCIVMEPVRGGALADLCPEANQILKEAAPDKSIASWAIRYAASLPNILTVLSGVSNLEQLKDNVKTLSSFEPLSNREKQVVEQALRVFKGKFSIPCTACRYCMDCPSGVDIPLMLALYNQYALSKNAWEYHALYTEQPSSVQACSCTGCNICIDKCPQSINIPQEMTRISRETDELFKPFRQRRGG